MRKRNIILTSIILLILGIIIGISFNIARARGLRAARLSLESVKVSKVVHLGVSRELGERASLAKTGELRSLKLEALNEELPSTSLNVLNA